MNSVSLVDIDLKIMAYRSVLGNSQGIAGIPGILGFCQEFPRTTVADWVKNGNMINPSYIGIFDVHASFKRTRDDLLTLTQSILLLDQLKNCYSLPFDREATYSAGKNDSGNSSTVVSIPLLHLLQSRTDYRVCNK